MSLKDTWAKWEKEEKERKPVIKSYQWVDRNGYICNGESEEWHFSIYDFILKLKSAIKITLVLYFTYVAFCLFFILQGNKFMHVPTTIEGTIAALLRLYVVVAIIRCYKYICGAICTIVGTIFLLAFIAIVLGILFFGIRAIV